MKKKKACKHYACGIVHGKDVIVELPFLTIYCQSLAQIYYVGLDDPPESEIMKVMREFKKFPYCPKCGEKWG